MDKKQSARIYSIPRIKKELIEVPYPHPDTVAFDECLDALNQHHSELITTEDLARARTHVSSRHPINMHAYWTIENHVYLPDGDIMITGKCGPILAMPKQATGINKLEKPVDVPPQVLNCLRERAEKDPEKAIKSDVLLLPRKAVRETTPVDALGDYAAARFLLREQAKPYGQFLKSNGIDELSHRVFDESLLRKYGRACVYASLLLNFGIDCGPGLYGRGALYFEDLRVRMCGIRESMGKGLTPKDLEDTFDEDLTFAQYI